MSGMGRGSIRSNRSLSAAIAACALALAGSVLAAQQTPQQAAPEKPSEAQQQPGAGAQVHTGIVNSGDLDQRIQNLLADHQFIQVQSALDQLPPEQTQLYRGILANRNNDPKASVDLLEPLVDSVAASGNAAHEKLLRKALAEDYLRLGDWPKAAKAYQALDAHVKLSADEADEIEMPLKMLPLAAANPPMTVEPCDPFLIQVSKDPLGLTDVPVFVDARSHSWMLDPTAPFNLIARSLAKEAGLKISEETATIHTLTGRPIQVHVTVIPRFTVAGRLTLRNMTAFVFDDADYFFPLNHYQVEGVLGYSAVAAMGSVTITADATIQVRPVQQIAPAAKDDRLTDGAQFFLDGDQVIVALGKAGEERMYVVDAGGQQTYFTSRYYDEHTGDFAGKKMELFTLPGSDNRPPAPAFIGESIALTAGTHTANVHYLQVLTAPLGTAALDDVYGTLGVDALDQLHAYTFDYRTMRFGVRPD